MKNYAIFDLDGTLANIVHRLHFIKNGNSDWDNFFKACPDDKPVLDVIGLLLTLRIAGKYIVIVSGRSDAVRAETTNWLLQHDVPFDELYMRPEGDHQPDFKLKLSIVKDHPEWAGNAIVFDDRKQVVDMWRKEGFTCFQVADGDF